MAGEDAQIRKRKSEKKASGTSGDGETKAPSKPVSTPKETQAASKPSRKPLLESALEPSTLLLTLLVAATDQPQCFFNVTEYTLLKLDTYGDENIAALGRDSESYIRKMAGIVACLKPTDNADEGVLKAAQIIRHFDGETTRRVPSAYGFPVTFVREAAEVVLARRRKADKRPPVPNGVTPPQKRAPAPTVEEFNERMATLLSHLPSYTPKKGNLADIVLANSRHSLFLEKHLNTDGSLNEDLSYFFTVAPHIPGARCGTWESTIRWGVPLSLVFGWAFAFAFAVVEGRRMRRKMVPAASPDSSVPST
ncbi:hypothetical protein HDU93_004635, partial [Gonapodya sp. JEL0774]